MKALVFGEFPDPMPPQPPEDAPHLVRQLASTPMSLKDIPDPKPIGPDWAVIRPRMTGICGSDTKQVLMDYEHGEDSPMTAFISFPQVLGHEVIATIEELGPDVDGVRARPASRAQPVAVVRARAASRRCARRARPATGACAGASSTAGSARGIHTGNSSDATGGFAELVPAHQQMMIPVPDGIADEVAVLGDPFAVCLHAITRNPPPPGGKALVYGAGALGTCATAILQRAVPDRRRRDRRGVGRAGDARRTARRDRVPSRATRRARRAARRVVGRRPAQAVGRAPAVLPGLHRRRLRHHRRAGDVRGRDARAQGARHDGPTRALHVDAGRVLAAVLQGDPVGRLQRVRHRGGRRRAQARHRPLPRSRRRRDGST